MSKRLIEEILYFVYGNIYAYGIMECGKMANNELLFAISGMIY